MGKCNLHLTRETDPVFFIIFCLLSLYIPAVAQQPLWKSKFVLRNPDGVKDTVWFGLDPSGASGFQAGLDSIHSSSSTPVSILAHDYLVQNQFQTSTCGNLKVVVENLDFSIDSGYVNFLFYLYSDDFPSSAYEPNVTELIFFPSELTLDTAGYKIHVGMLESFGGYLDAIDNTIGAVSDQHVDSTIWLTSEGPLPGCSNSSMAVQLRLWINQDPPPPTTGVSLTESKQHFEFNTIGSNLSIRGESNDRVSVFLSSSLGSVIYSGDFNRSINVNISSFPPGVYICSVMMNGRVVNTYKFSIRL